MSWLLMDMGNSRCKAVVSDAQSVQWLARYHWDNQDFMAEHWQQQLEAIRRDYPEISKVLISSVSSDARKALVSDWCEQLLQVTPDFAISTDLYEAQSKDLLNSYDEPLALGIDRWLAMVGAIEQTDKAFAVLDAGTAITLDLVDVDGKHLGGHIVPGAKLMQKALFGDTGKIAFGAKLDPSKANEQQWLGVNSLQAVELGTYQAALGYLQSCLERLHQHYGVAQLFVCGGDGAAMMQQISLPESIEWLDCPDLVFEGLFYQHKNG
ncbi:MAG: type III pantothenate kinase [Gammaproteobacteria bacterium]|nr:type III pantothenate kinase [Gammaproteobacteria bacterium]